MSEQLQLRRGTSSQVAAFTPQQGECVVDTTNNRLCVGDGSAAGGWPAAKLSEAVLNTAASNVLAVGANGSQAVVEIIEQLVTLSTSGATTTASAPIPAGALALAVGSRVTTTIVGPTSFEVGISGTLGLFGSGLGLTAGSTNWGLIGPQPFYTATSILITATGGTPSAGAVRLSIVYLAFPPPTS